MWAAFPDVADVSGKSCQRHHCAGFLHSANSHLPDSLCPAHSEPRSAADTALKCDGTSECGLDCAAKLEACGLDEEPRYLLRDRDAIYGSDFRRQAAVLDIKEVVTAARSPWQNPYAERVIGSIRRECLDHIIILNERHLKRVLSSYVTYYHGARTHLSLAKDAPDGREVQAIENGSVVELKRVGGLHHLYTRVAA